MMTSEQRKRLMLAGPGHWSDADVQMVVADALHQEMVRRKYGSPSLSASEARKVVLDAVGPEHAGGFRLARGWLEANGMTRLEGRIWLLPCPDLLDEHGYMVHQEGEDAPIGGEARQDG
jgi:hypothetical protein